MTYCKKYVAVFLLNVFALVLVPPVFLHHIFANHKDTVCDFKHKHDVITVESLHIHCSFFTASALLYDIPRLTVFEKPLRILINEVNSKIHFLYLKFNLLSLPARAPPVI